MQPVAITKSKSGRRYLKVRLDEWLMSLEGGAESTRIGERQGMAALRLANVKSVNR